MLKARSGREAEDEDLHLQGRSFFRFWFSPLPHRIHLQNNSEERGALWWAESHVLWSIMEKHCILGQASVVENVRGFAGDMEVSMAAALQDLLGFRVWV